MQTELVLVTLECVCLTPGPVETSSGFCLPLVAAPGSAGEGFSRFGRLCLQTQICVRGG